MPGLVPSVEVVRTDITALAVDAIVNAANSSLLGGGGVDGAIHRAAGPELLAACRRPVWNGGGSGERDLLRRTYLSAIEVARTEPKIRSIAFPAISTGAYGFPREEAARIALEVLRDHARAFDRVVVAVFSEADLALYRHTLAALP